MSEQTFKIGDEVYIRGDSFENIYLVTDFSNSIYTLFLNSDSTHTVKVLEHQLGLVDLDYLKMKNESNKRKLKDNGDKTMENKFNIGNKVFLKKDMFCNVFNIVGVQYKNKEFIYKLSSSRRGFIIYELESELELIGREKLDDTKETCTITVDKKLFPFAPGTEVVVRDGEWDLWRKGVFILCRPKATYSFLCEKDKYKECYPMSTHAHLLGTRCPADSLLICSKCGEAAPSKMGINYTYESNVVCENCAFKIFMRGNKNEKCI